MRVIVGAAATRPDRLFHKIISIPPSLSAFDQILVVVGGPVVVVE